MQVGSLVICTDTFYPRGYEEQLPIKGEIYTVRSFFKQDGEIYIRFVEIINKRQRYTTGQTECGFFIIAFREVQPPMNVSALFQDQLKSYQ